MYLSILLFSFFPIFSASSYVDNSTMWVFPEFPFRLKNYFTIEILSFGYNQKWAPGLLNSFPLREFVFAIDTTEMSLMQGTMVKYFNCVIVNV